MREGMAYWPPLMATPLSGITFRTYSRPEPPTATDLRHFLFGPPSFAISKHVPGPMYGYARAYRTFDTAGFRVYTACVATMSGGNNNNNNT